MMNSDTMQSGKLDLKKIFDDLSSDDYELQHQASDILLSQIKDNESFLNELCEFYDETKELYYQKRSIIMLKLIVTMRFKLIQRCFKDFNITIKNFIIQPNETIILEMFADLVYHISLRLKSGDYPPESIWEYLMNFLFLYQDHKTVLPFSNYLYSSLVQDKSFYLEYQQQLKEIAFPIINAGLQNDDQALLSCNIFGKIFKNVDDFDEIMHKNDENVDIINTIAQNSLLINENNEDNFYLFWSHLYKVSTPISNSLFVIAMSFYPNKNLCPKNRNMLLNFIIRRSDLINSEDDTLKIIITDYFNTQYQLEDLDNSNFIFKHLKKVDANKSCEIFLSIIKEFLKSENDKRQLVGLSLLPGFFDTYQNKIDWDISKLLEEIYDAIMKSDDHLKKWLIFLEVFLKINKVNPNDSETILNFLIENALKCKDGNIQYRVRDICKKLTIKPTFFEKIIDIFQEIEPESYALCFSILIYFLKVEQTMSSDDKLNSFFEKLIEIFNNSFQEVQELSDLFQKNHENFEIKKSLYQNTLLHGSACNLIFHLQFYFSQLKEHANIAIEIYFNIILPDRFQLCDLDDHNFFSLYNVKEDFSYIVRFMKEPALECIISYKDYIEKGKDIESLQHYMCLYPEYGIDWHQKLIRDFIYAIEDYNNDPTDKELPKYIISNFARQMSKWIYIFDSNLHRIYLEFIQNLIQPEIKSEIYNSISKILLRIVKPKRIEYNSENKWYSDVLGAVQNMALYMADIATNIEPTDLMHYFDGLSNLILLFAYSGNEIGHTLLEDLIDFFKETQEIAETKMQDLVIKLINLGYCSADEFQYFFPN